MGVVLVALPAGADAEHEQALGQRVEGAAVPNLRSLKLVDTQLSAAGVVELAAGVAASASLTVVNMLRNHLDKESAAMLTNTSLTIACSAVFS